jgi:Arc/MetJ-type ribon-helix-helix transcriptional regulator
MPMTVRLPPRTERAVDALARRRRQTRSDVVRDALEHYAAANRNQTGDDRPFAAWLDVIGVVSLKAARPATSRTQTTGERFAAIVREKARTRRAR